MTKMTKYSELIALWLRELGYSHCFTVGGGAIMHLLESCSQKFICIPTIHEVAAGIATEYFNVVSNGGKAFVLVTAGPGLTNMVTAFAGAWLESRELLVLGGQVKTSDAKTSQLRQRGIQEVDGVSIVQSLCKKAMRLSDCLDKQTFTEIVKFGAEARPGPIFLEFPLDIQGKPVLETELQIATPDDRPLIPPLLAAPDPSDLIQLAASVRKANRPVFLIGGGVSFATAERLRDRLDLCGVPLLASWNGADRVPCDMSLGFGRPNTWGQRSANLILQQSDLLIAFGSRLGLQQTGFNWQAFAPLADVIQIDCDREELAKGHPRLTWGLCCDAGQALSGLLNQDLGQHMDWVSYCRTIQQSLPLIEANSTGPGYISPYVFVDKLSKLCEDQDIIIPCSSGGAFTVMMQTFSIKSGQG